jgi:hypothetical protein
MLSFILYHSYSNRFANFLGNCERERELLKKTVSKRGAFWSCIWSELLQNPQQWSNDMYNPRSVAVPIVPCSIPFRRLQFCEDLYSVFCESWFLDTAFQPVEFTK